MLNLLGGDHIYRRTVDGDGREEPHTLAGRLPGADSKQLTLGLLQGLGGKGDQGGRQLGMGCGANTEDGCKDCTWLLND